MAKKQKTMGSKFRPSNADRFVNCPASVVMSRDFPIDEGTVYSESGNVAHALSEVCIEQDKDAKEFLGEALCADRGINIEVDEPMLEGVQSYVDWIRAQGFTDLTMEKEVKLPWVPNAGGLKTTGYADLVGYVEDFNVLMVMDYKNGVMPVPNDSLQFACYGYPLLFDKGSPYKKLKSVTVGKFQPNSMDGDTFGTRVWTRGELIKVKHRIVTAVEWVNNTKPEDVEEKHYCEGHWCKFCPNKAQCPLQAKALFDTLEPEQALPAPSGLTPDKIKTILKNRKAIQKWLDDVYNFELAKGIRGEALEGLKVVEGRNKARAWRKSVSDTELVEALVQDGGLDRDKCFKKEKPKVITPAAAKKLMKGKLDSVENMLDPAAKTLELVPDTDDRIGIEGEDFF
jgi:hypothetical protein